MSHAAIDRSQVGITSQPTCGKPATFNDQQGQNQSPWAAFVQPGGLCHQASCEISSATTAQASAAGSMRGK